MESTKPRYYAGIGSQETPADVCDLMTRAAAFLAGEGWVLRSGHAKGADQAFETGCDGKGEIWLPWRGFAGSSSPLVVAPDGPAMEMAARYHPAWPRLKHSHRLLHARNCHQVLGADLQTPVRFVMCWTRDGKATGGTGQAMRIAQDLGIRIINLRLDRDRALVEAKLSGTAPHP